MGQYPLLRCGDATIGPFSSGVVVRGSGSAQWWERAGAEAVRMGLLGRSEAGACPDLLQRRSGPGEAANESAEYQRFFSRAPARSGPLQQIWTNGAPAGPCADSGRGDHPDPRAGPTRPQRPGRPRPVVGPSRGEGGKAAPRGEGPAAAGSGAGRRPAPAHAGGARRRRARRGAPRPAARAVVA